MKDMRQWKAKDWVLDVILSLVVIVVFGNLIPAIQLMLKSYGH